MEKTALVRELQMFPERILSVEKRCSCWKATNFSKEKTFPHGKRLLRLPKEKNSLSWKATNVRGEKTANEETCHSYEREKLEETVLEVSTAKLFLYEI